MLVHYECRHLAETGWYRGLFRPFQFYLKGIFYFLLFPAKKLFLSLKINKFFPGGIINETLTKIQQIII